MAGAASKAPRVLYWFRTDLRLHDSPALRAALDLKPAAFFPLWCWDPTYIYKHRVGVNRFRFLLESMSALSESITSLNALSQLLVVRGDPAALIPELLKRWNIDTIAFEADVNAYPRARDAKIREIAKQAGVKVLEVHGHHLYNIDKVLESHGGKATTTMAALRKALEPLGDPAKPLDAPTSLPDVILPNSSSAPKDKSSMLVALRDSLEGLPHYHADGRPELDLNGAEAGGQRLADEAGKVTCYDSLVGPDADASTKASEAEALFSVPTLASLGMDPVSAGATAESLVPGGESAGLTRLSNVCSRVSYIATFEKPKTSPSTFTEDPSTTLLSPYLKFGCLSVRRVWWDTQAAITQHKGKKSDIPENFHGQLLFREMYAVVERATGDAYQGVRGNEVARYMDWYLPNVYDKEGKLILPRPKGDPVSEERWAAFVEGRTGFPWIDALVRQLRATGWIHHLGRHSLACFLTRGQMWISWERGLEMFDELLIDADPNANPGNWMWLSCSAFYHMYSRVYGVVTFPTKYDAQGSLVRKYCPELKDFPDKFIYCPHTAPLAVQKKANCIIGTDYPHPILDEKTEKANCQARIKAAFAAKLHGNSKEVLGGTAEAKLRKAHGIPDPKPYTPEGKDSKVPAWAKAGAKDDSKASGSKADGKRKADDEADSKGGSAKKAKKT